MKEQHRSQHQDQESEADRPRRSRARKFAEWVSLAISAVILLSLAGYLVMQALRADPPTVPIRVQCLVEEAREVEGRYILPVEVTNEGRRTVRDLRIEVVWHRTAEESPNRTELLIDFLGERSHEKAYVFLEGDPRQGKASARPLSYLLE